MCYESVKILNKTLSAIEFNLQMPNITEISKRKQPINKLLSFRLVKIRHLHPRNACLVKSKTQQLY